jgi:hypothetical protein
VSRWSDKNDEVPQNEKDHPHVVFQNKVDYFFHLIFLGLKTETPPTNHANDLGGMPWLTALIFFDCSRGFFIFSPILKTKSPTPGRIGQKVFV